MGVAKNERPDEREAVFARDLDQWGGRRKARVVELLRSCFA
jgi:hypothetical protein